MLIPDNIHPQKSVYYLASFVLKSLQDKGSTDLISLYKSVKEKKEMAFSVFILSLDWLYLIGLVDLNEERSVVLCS